MPRDDEREPDNREHDQYHREEPEDYERERGRRPRKKSSSGPSLLLIFGGIGCLIVVICGGIIAYAIYKVMPFMKGITQSTVTTEQFFDHLKQNQINAAYELTSKEYQKNFTPDQFADFVKKNDILVKHTSRSAAPPNFVQANDAKQVVIVMNLQAPSGSKNCTVILVEEQDKWKVNSLTLN